MAAQVPLIIGILLLVDFHAGGARAPSPVFFYAGSFLVALSNMLYSASQELNIADVELARMRGSLNSRQEIL